MMPLARRTPEAPCTGFERRRRDDEPRPVTRARPTWTVVAGRRFEGFLMGFGSIAFRPLPEGKGF